MSFFDKVEDEAQKEIQDFMRDKQVVQDTVSNNITTTTGISYDGTTVDVPGQGNYQLIKMGTPSPQDGAIIIGASGYAVMPENFTRQIGDDIFGHAYLLLKAAGSGDTDWFVRPISSATALYKLSVADQYFVSGATQEVGLSKISVNTKHFSPNGKHLFVGAIEQAPSGTPGYTDLVLHWGVIRNFQIDGITNKVVTTGPHAVILRGTKTISHADLATENVPDPPIPLISLGEHISVSNTFLDACSTTIHTSSTVDQTITFADVTSNPEIVANVVPHFLTIDGNWGFSNDANGNPIVDFAGSYFNIESRYTAFRPVSLTSEGTASQGVGISCAGCSFPRIEVGPCVYKSSEISSIGYIFLPPNTMRVTVSSAYSTEISGCVSGAIDCGLPDPTTWGPLPCGIGGSGCGTFASSGSVTINKPVFSVFSFLTGNRLDNLSANLMVNRNSAHGTFTIPNMQTAGIINHQKSRIESSVARVQVITTLGTDEAFMVADGSDNGAPIITTQTCFRATSGGTAELMFYDHVHTFPIIPSSYNVWTPFENAPGTAFSNNPVVYTDTQVFLSDLAIWTGHLGINALDSNKFQTVMPHPLNTVSIDTSHYDLAHAIGVIDTTIKGPKWNPSTHSLIDFTAP